MPIGSMFDAYAKIKEEVAAKASLPEPNKSEPAAAAKTPATTKPQVAAREPDRFVVGDPNHSQSDVFGLMNDIHNSTSDFNRIQTAVNVCRTTVFELCPKKVDADQLRVPADKVTPACEDMRSDLKTMIASGATDEQLANKAVETAEKAVKEEKDCNDGGGGVGVPVAVLEPKGAADKVGSAADEKPKIDEKELVDTAGKVGAAFVISRGLVTYVPVILSGLEALTAAASFILVPPAVFNEKTPEES